MEYVLTAQGLSKHYRNFKALDALTMHVPKGAIYGFVGRNGAGKTSLYLSNLILCSAGSLIMCTAAVVPGLCVGLPLLGGFNMGWTRAVLFFAGVYTLSLVWSALSTLLAMLVSNRILIIDDDVHIGNMLEELLAREGYQISRAYSGTEALLALSAVRPDLILLDLMLPGLSGEEVLPRLRGVPVIVLSAKADTDSKVTLLLGGAADYVTKPFDTKELLARIAVALRKGSRPEDGVLAYGPLRLDSAARQVSVNGAEVRLTPTEYAVLKLLMSNPAQVMTKSLHGTFCKTDLKCSGLARKRNTRPALRVGV